MNFCVVPREIRKINKRGGGSKLAAGGVSKNQEKNKRPPPVYFETESNVGKFSKFLEFFRNRAATAFEVGPGD